MDNQLISLVEKIVEKKLKEMQPMTREPAVVLSSDSENGTALVRFLSGSEYELLNKTGEVLSEGDSVWVEYRTLPSAGYIAMRNGKAVGLYEEADEKIGINAVQKFRTPIDLIHIKMISGYVDRIIGGEVWQLDEIPDVKGYWGCIVVHLTDTNTDNPSFGSSDISHFILQCGSSQQTQTPVWIGREMYVQFDIQPEQVGNNAKVLMVFNPDVVEGTRSTYMEVYAIDNSDYPGTRIDSNHEGAGSIRYSEFVRYVSEEINAIKQRLDALGG